MFRFKESAGGSGDGYADRLAAPVAVVRLAIVLALTLAACASRPGSVATSQAPLTATPGTQASPPRETPDQAISDLQQNDPGSPVALDGHLEYAGQLIDAHDAACEKRLSQAETELNAAAADPSFDVVLPLGIARLADLQYRLHVARASCQALGTERGVELQLALAAAQQAVVIYREALDYPSMTIAQFNVAVTQRLLGDDGGSLASLEAAIALDKEFGLHQDAIDNTLLLSRWRGGSGTAKGGLASADFPTRAVTLKSWQPRDARVSVQIEEATVVDAHITHDQAHRTFEQHVRHDPHSWIVSYQPGAIGYDSVQWPEETSDIRELATAFERGLGIPAFEVGLKGDFLRVPEIYTFSKVELAAARALMIDHLDSRQDPRRLGRSNRELMQVAFLPSTIETVAAESYNLRIGMWSGATLEQGVWYKLAAPLTLPGGRQLLAPNDIEFAYTHDVPCADAAIQHSCIEIVVHASPQADALKELMDELDSASVTPLSTHVHYWSATHVRIVMDPETLSTQVYDERRYWHASDNKAVRERLQNRSERIVTTFTYH